MGINGVGKTSFYGAMECICMGEMKTAAIHDVDSKKYVRNIFTPESNVSAALNTSVGSHELDLANLKPLCPPAYFISEWDIRELETISDFGNFIYAQLGLSNYLELIDLLQETIKKINAVKEERFNQKDIARKTRQLKHLQFYITFIQNRTVNLDNDVNYNFKPIPQILKNNVLLPDALQILDNYIEHINEDLQNSFFTNSLYFSFLSTKRFLYELNNLKQYITDKIGKDISSPDDKTLLFIKKANDERLFLNKMRLRFKSEIIYLTKKIGNNIEGAVSELLYLQSKIDEYNVGSSSSLLLNLGDEIKDIDQVRSFLADILKTLEIKFDQIMSKWVDEIISPTLNSLLADFLKDDGAVAEVFYNPLYVNNPAAPEGLIRNKERGIVARLIIPPGRGTSDNIAQAEIAPKEYLNTFRFKMFAVSLKVALAYCAKQIYMESWPIVIDDVFNSSDFNNRNRIGDYVSSLMSAHANVTGVYGKNLQLIFFTQDEIIGSSIFRAMKGDGEKCQLLRLHDYRCFEIDNQPTPGTTPCIDVTTVVEAC